MPEWKNLDPELLKLVAKHDPDNKFAMPYMWATTGIGYNVDKVKAVLGENAPVDSWNLILKPENLEKLKSCGVSFLDAPEEVFATVLNYLGKDPNSTKADDYTGPATDLLLKLRPNIRYFHSSNYLGKDPNSTKADDYTGPATDLLLKLRPNIRYFHSSQYINDLANGDICVAIGWASCARTFVISIHLNTLTTWQTAISASLLAGRAMSGRRQTARRKRRMALMSRSRFQKKGRWRSLMSSPCLRMPKTKTKPISS